MVAKQKDEVKKIRVQDHIVVHMIIDDPRAPENTIGWVHTHGMWEKFQLPDLEIRGVRPSFLMPDAGKMLNHIAQYMLDGKMGIGGAKPIKAGETFGVSHIQVMRIVESSPLNPTDEDEVAGHFSSPPWEVIPLPQVCTKCGKTHGKETIH